MSKKLKKEKIDIGAKLKKEKIDIGAMIISSTCRFRTFQPVEYPSLSPWEFIIAPV